MMELELELEQLAGCIPVPVAARLESASREFQLELVPVGLVLGL